MSTQQTVLRVQFDNVNSITGITEYEILDLYGNIPIKINKSFAELQDISKRNSDYSIGLQLPGSKKNNRFFENFFNVDTQSLYFNVLQRVPCQVLLNDESYFTGFLRLNKVSVMDSKVEYDVTLYSSIGDLFGNIGNNLLKDLDYDQDVLGYGYKFNHPFNKYEVQSWSNFSPYSLKDEPLYFYPIVHNGYNYSGDTVNLSGTSIGDIISGVTRLYTTTIAGSYTSNAAAYAAGVKRYRINSPEDGLIDNQLKPALSIRGLITLMFQNYGYTIKSDFFNTPWFRMLYMYGYFSSEATKFSFKVPPKSDAVSSKLAVKLTETFVDTSTSCGGYLWPKTTRTYTIQLVNKSTGVVTTSSTPTNIKLLFRYFDCGQTVGYDVNVPITIPTNTTGTTYSWISNQHVPCPSECKLEYKQNFGVNDSLSDVPEYSDLPPNTIVIYEDNDMVDFSLVIDWNLKQIDVLSSIAKKFNLVFVPDPEVQNQIIIEPYNYYIGTGNVHDWTPLLSYDKGFTVEPALNYVESELILTDLEDGDYGNKAFKDRNNRLYGENKVYNPTAFKSQSKNIDTVFSPELVRQWDTPDTAPNGNVKLPLGINYAANSSSKNSGGSENIVWTYPGVKTKPKLMYWSGNYNPFLDQVGEVITFSGNVLTNVFYIAESDGANPLQSFVTPVVGTTMPVGNPDSNKINNDSICNLFNSELPTDVGVTSFSAYTENDIYSLFYENRVENLYNPNTRFLSGYFNLKYSDIQNLKPNDVIKINEQYFTWNKIAGFNLTNSEMTKVELVQTNVNPQVYPTRYFMYYYCDNPSVVYKFKTDMTNPNLNKTNFGWSSLYDYNVGLLGGNISGYTSTYRDYQAPTDGYIPYYIYEVSDTTYNASGLDRQCDTFYNRALFTFGDGFDMPTYIYTNSTPIKIIANIFTSCSNFDFYKTTYNINTVSSTYYGIGCPTPTPTTTPTVTPTKTITPTPTLTSNFYGCYFFNQPAVSQMIDSDGRNIYTGYFSSYYGVSAVKAIALDNNFNVDNSFNMGSLTFIMNGYPINNIVESNDKKFYANYYNFQSFAQMSKINFDGSVSSQNFYVSGNDTIIGPVVDTQNRLWFGEYNTSFIGPVVSSTVKCLNSSGTLVFSSTVTGAVTGIVAQSTGKVIVSSSIYAVGNITLRRYNTDGSVDTTFNTNLGAYNSYPYQQMVIDKSNDKIYLSNNSNLIPAANGLIRLNSDGTFDSSFSYTGTAINGPFTLRPDGKLYVTLAGHTINSLNNNGTLNSTFATGDWTKGTSIDTPSAFSYLSNNNLVLFGYGVTANNEYTVSGLRRFRYSIVVVDTNGNVVDCPLPPTVVTPTPTPTLTQTPTRNP